MNEFWKDQLKGPERSMRDRMTVPGIALLRGSYLVVTGAGNVVSYPVGKEPAIIREILKLDKTQR
ncbi:hypothetical protein A2631_05135 [Candidatus Daviesbacteria bacterium RIFCSPHIGHO2_01_FULL_44_29]|nr:MAG: hypothetical protein A2631_05135 [Candidatus Daviesbacteria bacterium RIFCSPHIGHO2_01_FULL_44_29]OGE41052.1 MAG: hypothetical protein A3E86_04960 [Candidatus Daviesbacteria bacterium RIFCSPHIGHO2_12_FULL_47_45]OGE70215.1 MAG: hypothetical protein A3B55_00705 [Candidatus Daviesbacteria bacterium RIFCSPLOWO2_01_FULL_43_15]